MPRYIGMMGSKRKVIAVYKALEKEGFSAAQFERVHAPVGLDIGASDAGRNRREHYGGTDRGAPQRAGTAEQIHQDFRSRTTAG